MDRKWRTNRGAIDTVLGLEEFRAALPPPWPRPGYALASLTDLYAVYTALHIEGKRWEVRWSEEGRFLFFVARSLVYGGGGAAAAAAPEGDEDAPPLVAEAAADAAPAAPAAAAAPPAPPAAAADLEEAEGGAANASASAPPAAPPPPRLRTQLVVPLSSACGELTPLLLHRLFAIRGVQAQQLLLALVDSHGVVTRQTMYNYVQAPLEGPGAADLELLDD
jgi:hypothetical protein